MTINGVVRVVGRCFGGLFVSLILNVLVLFVVGRYVLFAVGVLVLVVVVCCCLLRCFLCCLLVVVDVWWLVVVCCC